MSSRIEWPTALIALGWVVHVLSWIGGVVRQRGRVAHEGEWTREVAIRLGMVALVVWALVTPAPRVAGIGDWIFVAIFWAGTALAVVGRSRLGAAWGIGVRPLGTAPVSHGLYATIAHPIYIGTVLVLAAQAAIVRNLPAVALVGASLVIVPLKILRENAALRRLASNGSAATHDEERRA